VKDLRHDLHKKGMSREQFKKYYYTELKDVDALLEGSEQLKKELYELEPEYMRLSKFAEQQIKLLRLQDSAR
jgi:predicted RNase H-like nuclease